MKNKFLVLVFALSISSCDLLEERWTYKGDITTLRLDDDGEYHFSTDTEVYHDESHYRILIERKDVENPKLYIKEHRCPDGNICSEGTSEWQEIGGKKIVLPLNYKIETFDD